MSINNIHDKLEMKIVPKGWGYEKWIVNKSEYCGKLLFFHQYKRCSWHYHILKDEVFYIQSGSVVLKYANHDFVNSAHQLRLNAGDSFHIPRKLRHQIIAITDSEVFEFSTEHFDSDSHRVEKGD